MPDALTLDDLIAWGRDYEQLLKTPGMIHLPRPMLDQYIAAANAALMQQREQERKKPRARGGRPKGGMGEQKLRLMEAGVIEENAERITANAFGKPPEAVRRASKSARKKSPR
jgi:hypothetical protein